MTKNDKKWWYRGGSLYFIVELGTLGHKAAAGSIWNMEYGIILTRIRKKKKNHFHQLK